MGWVHLVLSRRRWKEAQATHDAHRSKRKRTCPAGCPAPPSLPSCLPAPPVTHTLPPGLLIQRHTRIHSAPDMLPVLGSSLTGVAPQANVLLNAQHPPQAHRLPGTPKAPVPPRHPPQAHVGVVVLRTRLGRQPPQPNPQPGAHSAPHSTHMPCQSISNPRQARTSGRSWGLCRR